MIVAYDGIRAALNPSGLGSYSRFVLDAVTRYLPEVEAHVYVPLRRGSGRYRPSPGVVVQRPHPWPGNLVARTLWRRRLAGRIQRDGGELVHGLSNELPVGLRQRGLPGVVTIHDLIYLRYPRYFSAIDRKMYDRRYRRSANAATRIIAVSRQTADDLVRFFGVPASRIDVVGQGCAPEFYRIERRPASVPLVLYVGAFDPRKNIALIVEAARRLARQEVRFVLAGRSGGYARAVQKQIEHYGLQHRVTMEFDVSRERLLDLFAAAHAFVYPSEFEGFGIPLLEAMAAGVPVITARRSSLPEVAGDAALYIERDDPNLLAETIWSAVTDAVLARTLAERGRRRARLFLPDAIAEQIGEVYASALRTTAQAA